MNNYKCGNGKGTTAFATQRLQPIDVTGVEMENRAIEICLRNPVLLLKKIRNLKSDEYQTIATHRWLSCIERTFLVQHMCLFLPTWLLLINCKHLKTLNIVHYSSESQKRFQTKRISTS